MNADWLADLEHPPGSAEEVEQMQREGLLPSPAKLTKRTPIAALTLSKSEVATLRACPRRYHYEYVLGRTSARGPGIEAEWGAALHRGLEFILAGYHYQGKEPWPQGGIDLALKSIDVRGADQDGRPIAPMADPFARASLRAMLRAYVEVWGESDQARYEVLHVELSFDLPILTSKGNVSRGSQEGARREGRMDAVIAEREITLPLCHRCREPGEPGIIACNHGGGRVWIMEHKSTGKPPGEDRFYAGIELDLQTALYFDAAREMGLAPAGVLYDVIRRPDFDEPKPAPALTKTGKERKAPTEACGECEGTGKQAEWTDGKDAPPGRYSVPCVPCAGSGRVAKQVHYSNPRYGESPADYEQRIYELATSAPADWFGRRELPILDWQIQEARQDMHAAALEVRWRERTGHYPRVGDRYVCAQPRKVCPWLEVCGRVASVDDDRLFPLKVRSGEQGQ